MCSGYCQTTCCSVPPLPLFHKAVAIPSSSSLAEAALWGWIGALWVSAVWDLLGEVYVVACEVLCSIVV
jgi:hypothetical protein